MCYIAAMYFDYNRTAPALCLAAAEAAQRALAAPLAERAAHAAALRRLIASECGFEPHEYEIFFTGSAAEGAARLLTACARSFTRKTGRLPHVVSGAAEAPDTLRCIGRLVKDKLCQHTALRADDLGVVDAADLPTALRPNTCLVSCAAAHCDTGALNNLRALAAAAHKMGVPFHTDAAQLFGRSALRPAALGVDAFSASFHRAGGLTGLGVLVVRRSLVDGYGLCLTHDDANWLGLAAAAAALRDALAGRPAKMAHAAALRDRLRAGLAARRLACFPIGDAPTSPPSIDGGITPPPAGRPAGAAAAAALRGRRPVIFWVAPADPRLALPNTTLMDIRNTRMGAEKIREALSDVGVTVAAVAGRVRVSFGDATTAAEVDALVAALCAVLSSA